VIKVAISSSVHLSDVSSSVCGDGCQFAELQHAVCCSCGVGFPGDSLGSEVATRSCLTTVTMQFSPLGLFLGATALSVVARMLRLSVAATR
jgi:hypothetical protein